MMRRVFQSRISLRLALLLALIAVSPVRAAESASPREVSNFNREWTFLLGEVSGAEAVKFDDAKWDRIGLRKHFDVPAHGTAARALRSPSRRNDEPLIEISP